MRRIAIALTTVVLFTASIAGQPPQGRGRGGRGNQRVRKAVLAWADTRNGIAQHDSTSHALAVIERLGYESGAYDTYIRTDSNIISKHPQMTDGKAASGGPSLENVDAIFFLGHRERYTIVAEMLLDHPAEPAHVVNQRLALRVRNGREQFVHDAHVVGRPGLLEPPHHVSCLGHD